MVSSLEYGYRLVGRPRGVMFEDGEPVHVGLHGGGRFHGRNITEVIWRQAEGLSESCTDQSTYTSPAMSPAQVRDESRQSPKWQVRRDAIIDTSAPLFARRGYHATGISELCEANDLGKGALYHYIGSKEELLAAIHDQVMDEVMARRASASPRRGGRRPCSWPITGTNCST